MELRIKRTHPSATIPTRARPGDSGLDLHACLPDGPVHIPPGERHFFDTGIAIELPSASGYLECAGYEGQVRGRSSLNAQGIVLGGIGTVDAGYRGPIGVVLLNQSFSTYRVDHGQRIAQLVICPVVYPTVIEVAELSSTERGDGGFGSTGL